MAAITFFKTTASIAVFLLKKVWPSWYNEHTMVFSFFKKDKQDDSLALLLDIGSGSVGGALVHLETGKAPHVIATVREDISFQDALSSARFLASMLVALEHVLKDIQKKTKNGHVPGHIFCTLSSPWFILKTRHLRIVRENPFKVTNESLEGFFEEDIAHLKEELNETLPSKDVAIIEKRILQIRLNGYEIKNPYGKTTDKIELTTTVSVSSERVVQNIKHKIAQFFHTTSLSFGVFPLAAFSAVRDIFPEEQNFLFVDITGEATDVSLVSHDLLLGTISFPYGKNFFIRELSSALHTVHEEAATLFKMFLTGTLDGLKHKKVEEVVMRTEEEWRGRFEKSLQALLTLGALPDKVFFTADTDMAPFSLGLIGGLKSEITRVNAFEIQHLDQFIATNFVTFESEVLRDPFLVIEALLATKALSPHNK